MEDDRLCSRNWKLNYVQQNSMSFSCLQICQFWPNKVLTHPNKKCLCMNILCLKGDFSFVFQQEMNYCIFCIVFLKKRPTHTKICRLNYCPFKIVKMIILRFLPHSFIHEKSILYITILFIILIALFT